MEQKSKADPNLTARNLCSIQRIDPCAVAILDKATHAAKYNFDVPSKSWTKTNIEGALFIIQRVDKPYYSMIIANRQSLDDMVEPVNPLTKMNLEGHYLFFCKPDNQIYGLWFFSTDDCSRIYNLLKKLQEEIKSGKIPSPPTSDEAGASNVPQSVAPPNESNQLLDLLKSSQPTPSVQIKSAEVSLTYHFRYRRMRTAVKIIRHLYIYHHHHKINWRKINRSRGTNCGGTGATASEMPVLLQKLMIQEQPKLISKVGSSALTSEDLEKDLLRSAKPKHAQFPDMYGSASAASLAALSNRSMHGSDGEADANELESVMSSRAIGDDSAFAIGSGATTPPLNKMQFASALIHLMQTDDQFLTQIHQAYVDAINRRITRT
ncbi:Dcp1-like decapping family protein [Oesophagostomum dentatum]|uniref:Dcp1-like decapping family protein n=1 Tax=Oesophagostomum dentatum TaxID=61180 RepID=A0A0B1T782_OESDE|nr:Dcp1-like decapping family protein [Oesophagostomum dentatum]